ncbi:MAG: hypothetical protein CMJ83_02905 [Planctomycetes bacterium]|nr:hypothetical protein [Planctomycetota bacterium]
MEIGSQITFSGLATGLDSRAIIDALLQVESIPILRMQNRKSMLNTQDSVFSTLDSRLDDLRSAVEALDSIGELASYTASSSDEDAISVTASGTATEGTNSVDVVGLAAAESRTTGGYANADALDIGTGSFTIMVDGNNYNVDLNSSPNNTLQDVRDAINASGAPVSASIIDTGSGADPFQLVINSTETGAENAFSVDLTGFTPVEPAKFNIDDIASRLQTGVDAHIRVNNLDVYRPTNTISDVIEGVTLDIKSVSARTQVTVNRDNQGIKDKVQSFLDAYNDIATIMDAQNQVDEEGSTDAVLFGDSGLRSIASRLRQAVNHSPASLTGNFTSLAAIGITSDSTGKLNLDSSDFDAALASDFQGVMDLFTSTTDGSAKEFKAAVDDLTDPVNGIIKIRKDGISSRQSTLDDRIEALTNRLADYEERLIQRFATLETQVSSFQAQGSALSSFQF